MNRRVHACILTTAHPPSDTRVFTKEARTLARAGHGVTFIVPHDRDETIDGVRLVAIPRAAGRWSRWLLGPWRVWRAARKVPADVYHFHDPELLPVGVLLRWGGAAVVYDVHEDVPKDVLGKRYLPGWSRPILARVLGAVQRRLASTLSLIIVAREDIAPSFRGHPRVVVVSNYPSKTLAGPTPPARGAATGPLRIAYVGSMTSIRGIREMADAMALLPPGVDARLELYGRFSSPAFEAHVRASPGASRVTFHGQIGYDRVPGALAAAEVGIVCFLPEPNNVNSGPTKLFEYMACGLPVIASDFPEWRVVVVEGECGVCVDPRSPEAIAGAIAGFAARRAELAAIGRRGWEAIQGKLNWEAEAETLLAAYAALRP